MVTFWIIAGLLTLIALAFVIPPLLLPPKITVNDDHNKANISIYKERLAELEAESLPTEEFNKRKQALEKNLAQELTDNQNLVTTAKSQWLSGLLILVLMPALAGGLYLRYGEPELITDTTNTANTSVSDNGHTSDEQEMEAAIAQLAQRLEKSPDNGDGWYMLARSYATLEKFPKAIHAYTKALALLGDTNTQLLADFAETAAVANEGKLNGLPSFLLQKILTINPHHEKALWLSGFAAAQQENYHQAITHWETLLAQIPASETRVINALQQQIAQARQTLEAGQIPLAPQKPPEETSSQPENAAQGEKTSSQPENAPQIQVQVQLAKELQSQVSNTDTVFVYARPLEGTKMPLAIVRKSVQDLPFNVTLNDDLAMMPTHKLSQFKQISIFARISPSGQATAQSGDFLGKITPVEVTQQQVSLVIDAVIP